SVKSAVALVTFDVTWPSLVSAPGAGLIGGKPRGLARQQPERISSSDAIARTLYFERRRMLSGCQAPLLCFIGFVGSETSRGGEIEDNCGGELGVVVENGTSAYLLAL
ncbi:hypothetical protein DNTS_021601, partial [Danionella cerebrum]